MFWKNSFTIGIRVYKNDGQTRMNKGQESHWGSSGKLQLEGEGGELVTSPRKHPTGGSPRLMGKLFQKAWKYPTGGHSLKR